MLQGTTSPTGQGGRSWGILPLSQSLYRLSDDEATFFKRQTGIENDDDLRKHISDIQADAYEIYPYPCLRRFDFVRLKISLHPSYSLLLAKGKDESTLLLDVGCCFGNDVQKVVLDGFPADQVVACDLHQEFWDLGDRLLKRTANIKFICGDIFDDALLDLQEYNSRTVTIPSYSKPSLENIHSLTPLQGQFSAIHAAALFHLFDEEQQSELARRLASCLSPRAGSFIFGSHISRPQKGFRVEAAELGALGAAMFCHSEESWKELWNGRIFSPGTVRVETFLEELLRKDQRPKEGVKFYRLVWTVIRI